MEERLPELNLEERAGGSECQKDMGGGIMKSGKGAGAEGGQCEAATAREPGDYTQIRAAGVQAKCGRR